MTNKCKNCGSSVVRIDVESISYLDVDLVAKKTTFVPDGVCPEEYSNLRCAVCDTPRGDVNEDIDTEKIWDWE
jgi:hypothetical protein